MTKTTWILLAAGAGALYLATRPAVPANVHRVEGVHLTAQQIADAQSEDHMMHGDDPNFWADTGKAIKKAGEILLSIFGL